MAVFFALHGGGSYARIQPGSASGTQCLESYNSNDWRDAFTLADGTLRACMDPDEYLIQLREALLQYGRQLVLANGAPLPDRPIGRDPTSCNGTKLKQLGRSTALDIKEYHELHGNIIHRVEISGVGDTWVMPRSLVQPVRQTPDAPVNVWMPVEVSKLQTHPTLAEQCAKLAVTNDGRRLCQLWKEAGILYQGSQANLPQCGRLSLCGSFCSVSPRKKCCYGPSLMLTTLTCFRIVYPHGLSHGLYIRPTYGTMMLHVTA